MVYDPSDFPSMTEILFRPRHVLTGALVLVAFTLAGCAASAGMDPVDATPTAPAADEADLSRDDEPIDPDLAVLTFDSAWSRINSSYYDPDFRGIDWPGIRDELRPSVADVETRGELRSVLRDMLSRLGESHFAIFPQESVDQISVDDDDTMADEAGEGDVGLELRWVEGRLTVFRAHEGSASAAGVQPGWVVEAIDDREMERWETLVAEAESETARTGLQTQTVSGAHALLGGPVGSEVTVRLRDGQDEVRTLTLERSPIRGEMVRFGQLPAMAAFLDYRRVPAGAGCVGLVEFNIWMVPLVAEFNRAVDAVDDCTGIVLDIRGNPGGVGGMVMSTAGSFFAERADLGVVQSRAGEITFVAMPRGVDTEGQIREAFEGRLAVLIDEMSMSTSEIFAAGLKSTGRARLFGTSTPGVPLSLVLDSRLRPREVLLGIFPGDVQLQAGNDHR